VRKPRNVERLYIDFDSFFATAEQHLRPELRGRPVGIIPLDTPHTGLIAASREAKRCGVKRGLWVREARHLCPEIVIVPARHEQYVRLHKGILAAVERILPVIAVRSIDEMVCTLSPDEQARAVAVARTVKTSIAEGVGPALTCSVGLGPNELLAKIAAEMEKPDALVMLHPDDLPGRLLGLKLTDIPGIASRTAARLERARITDVAGLWEMAPKHARAVWGSVEGERLWAALHGYAVEPPTTTRVMYGHGRVLPNDWRTPDKVHACARFLAVKAARRMRREGFAARTLSLWFTDRRSAGWFGEESIGPAFDDRTILTSLSRLVAAARTGGAPARSRSVHVVLHDLVPIGDVPRDLFEDEEEHARRRRFERLSLLADSLNGRFGRSVLHLGPLVEPPGGYAGAKIAFGRIPEEADF
jgi:DNA polymerase-4